MGGWQEGLPVHIPFSTSTQYPSSWKMTFSEMEVLGPTIKQGRSEDIWMVPHCTETHKVTSNIFMASFEGKGVWASNICLMEE